MRPCCFCGSDAGSVGSREELLQGSGGCCAKLSWLRVAHDEKCASLLSSGYRGGASADASRHCQSPRSVHCCVVDVNVDADVKLEVKRCSCKELCGDLVVYIQ